MSTADNELEQAISVGESLDELENREVWLDAEFTIPILKDNRWFVSNIGVSSIVGFLPGAGDLAMMFVASTIVYRGMRLGAPTGTLIWMSIILLVEGIIGTIPFLGDYIGLRWPANIQNVGYLRANQESLSGSTNWVFVGLLLSPFVLIFLLLGSLL